MTYKQRSMVVLAMGLVLAAAGAAPGCADFGSPERSSAERSQAQERASALVAAFLEDRCTVYVPAVYPSPSPSSSPVPAAPEPPASLEVFVDGARVPTDGSAVVDLAPSTSSATRTKSLVVRSAYSLFATVNATTSPAFRVFEPSADPVATTHLTLGPNDGAVLAIATAPAPRTSVGGTLRLYVGGRQVCINLQTPSSAVQRVALERPSGALASSLETNVPTSLGTFANASRPDIDLLVRNDYGVTIYRVSAQVVASPAATIVVDAPLQLAPGATAHWRFSLPKTRSGVQVASLRLAYAIGAPYDPAASPEARPRIDERTYPVAWTSAALPATASFDVLVDGALQTNPAAIPIAFASAAVSHTVIVSNTGSVPIYLNTRMNPPIVASGTLVDAFAAAARDGRGTIKLDPRTSLTASLRVDARELTGSLATTIAFGGAR